MTKRPVMAIPGIVTCLFFLCLGKQTDSTASAGLHKPHGAKMTKSSMKKEEKKTMATDSHPPLGITAEMPLDKIELVYGFYSSKTGAGSQEITLRADGTVKLFYSRSYDDPQPKVVEAKCGSEQILRLFDLLEGLGFYGLPDEFSSNERSYARRLLKFTMPGREKTVAVDEPGNYAIEQCIGAVKMCAGLCIPEAINQRFFPNL
jgi:hypothetical protein